MTNNTPELTTPHETSCRDCGCTDSVACWPTCTWTEPDLCSQCSPSFVHEVAPALEDLLTPMAELHPHPARARTRDQVAAGVLRDSLHDLGQYRPVIARELPVDEGSLPWLEVLAGHGIVEESAALGWNSVAVVVHARISDEQAARIVAVDNKSADLGGYDLLMLEELLSILPDLSATGYFPDDLAEIKALNAANEMQVFTDPDDIPEPPAVPISSAGDVWVLGPHRLVVGDARWMDPLDAALGYDDNDNRRLADLLLTDPPYNVAYEGTGGKTIENDDLAAAEFEQFLGALMFQAAEHMKAGAAAYVFHADSEGVAFREAFGSVLDLKQVLVWVKDQFVLGRQDHQWQHEPILYGWKPGAAHSWYGGRTLTTVIDDARDPAEWSKAELVDALRAIRAESSTVIRHERPRRSDEHPTMKPVELLVDLIEHSTRAGQLVLDVCAGSGSTLIACHQVGRVAALVEFDPVYADVICRRFEEHTGVIPVLKSGGSEDLRPGPFSFVFDAEVAS